MEAYALEEALVPLQERVQAPGGTGAEDCVNPSRGGGAQAEDPPGMHTGHSCTDARSFKKGQFAKESNFVGSVALQETSNAFDWLVIRCDS